MGILGSLLVNLATWVVWWRCTRKLPLGPTDSPRQGFPLRSVTFRPPFHCVPEQGLNSGRRDRSIRDRSVQRSLYFCNVWILRSATFLHNPPIKTNKFWCVLYVPLRSCTTLQQTRKKHQFVVRSATFLNNPPIKQQQTQSFSIRSCTTLRSSMNVTSKFP